MKRILIVIVASLATAPAALVTVQDQVKVLWNDQIHTGRILFSSSSDTILLARDGQIHHLPGTSKTEAAAVKVHLEPESLADISQQLRREFGPNQRSRLPGITQSSIRVDKLSYGKQSSKISTAVFTNISVDEILNSVSRNSSWSQVSLTPGANSSTAHGEWVIALPRE